mmetsp:Transcript_18215/g.50755  ORF Transcript_18215/g.50755 Transcript_18215/m.50755 type:complete len:201 (+) Transcript_18215:566-1168(+)
MWTTTTTSVIATRVAAAVDATIRGRFPVQGAHGVKEKGIGLVLGFVVVLGALGDRSCSELRLVNVQELVIGTYLAVLQELAQVVGRGFVPQKGGYDQPVLHHRQRTSQPAVQDAGAGGCCCYCCHNSSLVVDVDVVRAAATPAHQFFDHQQVVQFVVGPGIMHSHGVGAFEIGLVRDAIVWVLELDLVFVACTVQSSPIA